LYKQGVESAVVMAFVAEKNYLASRLPSPVRQRFRQPDEAAQRDQIQRRHKKGRRVAMSVAALILRAPFLRTLFSIAVLSRHYPWPLSMSGKACSNR